MPELVFRTNSRELQFIREILDRNFSEKYVSTPTKNVNLLNKSTELLKNMQFQTNVSERVYGSTESESVLSIEESIANLNLTEHDQLALDDLLLFKARLECVRYHKDSQSERVVRVFLKVVFAV